MDHIPSYLFDLVEHTPFNQLSDADRTEALHYFTEEEYTALHLAAQQALTFNREHDIIPNAHTRQSLLDAFDRKHSRPKARRSFALYPVQLWKAAAIVVFCLGITLWTFLRQYTPGDIRYVTVKDTVYVASAADTVFPEKVHDTVYITVESPVYRTAQRSRSRSVPQDNSGSSEINRIIPGDIHILKLRDKDELYNTSKGISREEDTLLKQYPFVTL